MCFVIAAIGENLGWRTACKLVFLILFCLTLMFLIWALGVAFLTWLTWDFIVSILGLISGTI
jgi:hypothetical protein